MDMLSSRKRGALGWTLLEAERRIDELETAAVKAARLLAETARHHAVVDTKTEAMLLCVELLVEELFKEGIKHSEVVEENLGHAMIAAAEAELRKVVGRKGGQKR